MNAIPHRWLSYAERHRQAAAKRLARSDIKNTTEREERLAAIRYHATELAWHMAGLTEAGVLRALKAHWPAICRAELARVKDDE